MAPPTGIKTITIYTWTQDGDFLACRHDPPLPPARPVRGRSESEVVEQVKADTNRHLRAWLLLVEPYYVESILEHQVRFEVKRLLTPCREGLCGGS